MPPPPLSLSLSVCLSLSITRPLSVYIATHIYILSQIQDLKINIGLYRDDELAITRQTLREVEMTKKKPCKIFRENEIRITVEANKRVVDFLDITLNLGTGAYEPYKKPNDTINYIHRESNHPPSIIHNLPKGIGIRLSTNSSSNEIFQEAAKPYNDALKQNGYKQLLMCSKNENVQDKREKTTRKSAQENMSLPKNIQNEEIKEINKDKRRRKITWFNPPYSKNVATNIGKKLFSLLSMCFPPENKLYKIINKNTIKLSYSCMNSIHQIITSHNKTVLSNEKSEAEQTRYANAGIKHHALSKANASKKVLYTKQLSCKVTQANKVHIFEPQKTSSKSAIISIYPALRLNIDYQQRHSANTSGS